MTDIEMNMWQLYLWRCYGTVC